MASRIGNKPPPPPPPPPKPATTKPAASKPVSTQAPQSNQVQTGGSGGVYRTSNPTSAAINAPVNPGTPSMDPRATGAQSFNVGALLTQGLQALRQIASTLPVAGANPTTPAQGTGGTDPVGSELSLSMSTVTASLQIELAKQPPDPEAIAALVTAGQAALTSSASTLTNLPTDLAEEPALSIAAEAYALGTVLEQAAAVLPPGPQQAQAQQGVLDAAAVQQQAEAMAAMASYVKNPSEAGFDTYVLEFAEAQLATQSADLNRAALLLENATPEQWAELGVAAAQMSALMQILQQPEPFSTLDRELRLLNDQCRLVERDWVAAPSGMPGAPEPLGPQLSSITNGVITGLPLTSEQLLALPPDQQQQVIDAMASYSGRAIRSPPPGFDIPAIGAPLNQALSTANALRASGLTFEQYQAQAADRIAELYQQNPLLGIVNPAELAQSLPPGITAQFSISDGQLVSSVQVGTTSYAPDQSPASREAMLTHLTSRPGFQDATAALAPRYIGLLQSARADIITLQDNLARADPPPTARDLLPAASNAFEAMVSRLASPGELAGVDGQPGPLGNAVIFTGDLFQRYADEQQAQARTDLVIGVGGAVAGIAATVLTIATAGAASPLLIGSLAAMSLASGGYSMYRSHQQYVDAERLSQFGQLSGVEDPNEFLYALEQGMNLFGIVMDAADLAIAARALRGVDAATQAAETARLLEGFNSVEEFLASPFGRRLAGRMDDGAEVTEATLQSLRDLQAGRYSFEQIADITNRAVTAPETLTDAERALNDIVRAERLFTPEAVDLFQRYHLAQGISPEDAYRNALAATGGDDSLVPDQIKRDFVAWAQRPSTIENAMSISMSLNQGLPRRHVNALRKLGIEDFSQVQVHTGISGRPVYEAQGKLWMYTAPDRLVEVPRSYLADTPRLPPANLRPDSLTAAGLNGLVQPENLRVFQEMEGGSVLIDRTTGSFYFMRSDGSVTDFYVHATNAGNLPNIMENGLQASGDGLYVISSQDTPDWFNVRNRSGVPMGDVLDSKALGTGSADSGLVFIFTPRSPTDPATFHMHSPITGENGQVIGLDRSEMSLEEWSQHRPGYAPEVILENSIPWSQVTMVLGPDGQIIHPPQ